MDKKTLYDLLFWIEAQKRSAEATRSFFQKGSKNYKWNDYWVENYSRAFDIVEDYMSRKNDFNKRYNLNMTKDDNDEAIC